MIKFLLTIYFFNLIEQGKIIVHIHRGDFLHFFKRSWLHKLLIRLSFLRISRLIVLSRAQKNQIAFYFPDVSIFVVENSVLEERNLPAFLANVS